MYIYLNIFNFLLTREVLRTMTWIFCYFSLFAINKLLVSFEIVYSFKRITYIFIVIQYHVKTFQLLKPTYSYISQELMENVILPLAIKPFRWEINGTDGERHFTPCYQVA